MNLLPVRPENIADVDSRTQYFNDLEHLSFDIPCCTCYALPYDEVVDRLRSSYAEFVEEAHRRQYPACVQIQSTICADSKLDIGEAQYDISNNPVKWGEKGFFASFSSDAWKDYLKRLISFFVKEVGFDYVLFEEPVYRVDIPGSKDRFYKKFTAEHPELDYPKAREESIGYLSIQEAKADALVGFYSDLAAYAKSAGAQKVGVVPWSFIPGIENTPEDTLNPSCDIDKIAAIPDIDLLAVRMQPDDIYSNTMHTGDEMQKSPKLYYVEIMAHAQGKDLITVSNPIDEHKDPSGSALLPFDIFRDATLASFAASPNGFIRNGYGESQSDAAAYMEFLSEAAQYAGRLGQPKSPVAFVFSYSGTRHAEPLTYETVFSHYWMLAKQMAFKAHLPMLTFYADTLEHNLLEHPEVRVLVFEEHFPLNSDQMSVVRDWWQAGNEKHAILAFGSGKGFSADINLPGEQPITQALPGIFEMIGLRQEDKLQADFDNHINLQDVSRVRRSAFLGDNTELNISKIANVRRIFGSRANVLFETIVGDTRIPVVAEKRDRSTLALFCGFGISSETAAAAENAIRYVLREMDYPYLMIDSCSDGILWNINKNDYTVMCNISNEKGSAVGHPGRANFWDCRARKMLPDGDPQFKFEPNSFQIYRVVGRRSKFLDVLGASYLRNLTDGAGRAEIELIAGKETVLLLRASPKEISVDGKPSTVSQEVVDGIYYVTLQQCPPGERQILLRW